MPPAPLPLSALRNLTPQDRLWRYFSGEAGLLKIVVVYSVAVGILSLAVPLAVQVLINTIAFRTVLQPVIVLSAALFFALAAATVLHALQTVAVEQLARRLVLRVIADFPYRLAGRSHKADAVLSHRFFEVASADKALASLLFEGLAAALQIAAAMFLLAVYHPSLLGFAVLLALSIWLSIQLLGRGAIASSLAESSAKYSVAEMLHDIEHDPNASGTLLHPRARVEPLARQWVATRQRHFSIVLRQQVALSVIGASFSALLLFVGGQLVIEGQLSLGQLVAAELVTAVAIRSLAKIGQQLPKYYDLVTSMEKLGSVVDLSPSHDTSKPDDTTADGAAPSTGVA